MAISPQLGDDSLFFTQFCDSLATDCIGHEWAQKWKFSWMLPSTTWSCTAMHVAMKNHSGVIVYTYRIRLRHFDLASATKHRLRLRNTSSYVYLILHTQYPRAVQYYAIEAVILYLLLHPIINLKHYSQKYNNNYKKRWANNLMHAVSKTSDAE